MLNLSRGELTWSEGVRTKGVTGGGQDVPVLIKTCCVTIANSQGITKEIVLI